MSDKSLIQKWMQEQTRKKKRGGSSSAVASSLTLCAVGSIACIGILALGIMIYLPMAMKSSSSSSSSSQVHHAGGGTTRKNKPQTPNIPDNGLLASSSKSKSSSSSSLATSSPISLTFYTEANCMGVAHTITIADTVQGNYDMCGKKFPNGMDLKDNLKSWKPSGTGEIETHLNCGMDSYWASLFPKIDGCTNFWTWPLTQRVKLKPISYLSSPQPFYPHSRNSTVSDYHIVWSGESSRYMGYQAQANYYGFLISNNDWSGRWTRVMTAGQPDDLASQFPTFYAKRHPYSRRYGPLNKADGIIKWYESVDRPKSEVIVLIDPDNWLTNSVADIAKKVKRGQGLAQAAWYSGSSQLKNLWKIVCKERCNEPVYATAVPYFIHRDDLAVVAPLWRMYTLMLKERTEVDQAFKQQYQGLQIDWGAEMLGWNFACTHAGVHFTVLPRVQVRDVDSPLPKNLEKEVKMIHMGRAWFPKNYAPAEQWRHTEGRNWNYRGVQVWCKCNVTADKIYPWPIPEGTDYQSRITLEYLYKSREKFGVIPDSPLRPRNYHEPLA